MKVYAPRSTVQTAGIINLLGRSIFIYPWDIQLIGPSVSCKFFFSFYFSRIFFFYFHFFVLPFVCPFSISLFSLLLPLTLAAASFHFSNLPCLLLLTRLFGYRIRVLEICYSRQFIVPIAYFDTVESSKDVCAHARAHTNIYAYM